MKKLILLFTAMVFFVACEKADEKTFYVDPDVAHVASMLNGTYEGHPTSFKTEQITFRPYLEPTQETFVDSYGSDKVVIFGECDILSYIGDSPNDYNVPETHKYSIEVKSDQEYEIILYPILYGNITSRHLSNVTETSFKMYAYDVEFVKVQ